MDLSKLLRVRDDFARAYERSPGDFVSLGFTLDGERPCLRVVVMEPSVASSLPHEYGGVQVETTVSAPAVLALGPVV